MSSQNYQPLQLLIILVLCFQAFSLRSLVRPAIKTHVDLSPVPFYCVWNSFNLRRRQVMKDGMSFVRIGFGFQPGKLRFSCKMSFRLGRESKLPSLITSSLLRIHTQMDDVISWVKSKHWLQLENPTTDLPHCKPGHKAGRQTSLSPSTASLSVCGTWTVLRPHRKWNSEHCSANPCEV